MKKYQHTNNMGNTHTIIVRDDNSVVMHNQHRIPECLSNVAFLMQNVNGYAAQATQVRVAARIGLEQLRTVTKLDWVEIEVPVVLTNVHLEPITSMFKLREHYRTFDVLVDWLVTKVDGIQRHGGHRYTGKLIDVLRKMEEDFQVGLVDGIEPHEEAPDRLNMLIECNGNVEQLIIFDLKHNRQLM
jgi:hypothetical protein